jgi:hypothetical protein
LNACDVANLGKPTCPRGRSSAEVGRKVAEKEREDPALISVILRQLLTAELGSERAYSGDVQFGSGMN